MLFTTRTIYTGNVHQDKDRLVTAGDAEWHQTSNTQMIGYNEAKS